jgi:hypothetical protein
MLGRHTPGVGQSLRTSTTLGGSSAPDFSRGGRPAVAAFEQSEKKDSFSMDIELTSKQVTTAAGPNPRRVAAGRSNRAKRKGLTPAGRERLRRAALRNRPWRFATGPQTAAGKARSARNGRARQRGPVSVRRLRAGLADVRALLGDLCAGRRAAAGLPADA